LCLEIFSTIRIERFNQMSQIRYKWLHQHISSPILPQPQSQSIPPTSCFNSTKTISRIHCLMEASRAGCSWALSMISGAICNEGVDCPGNRPTHHSTHKPSHLKRKANLLKIELASSQAFMRNQVYSGRLEPLLHCLGTLRTNWFWCSRNDWGFESVWAGIKCCTSNAKIEGQSADEYLCYSKTFEAAF
jgi:hypothetical protein